ncbi:MAG: DUF1232 domain-containing protein [Bacteroidales bacterium]|nr:DUF1232 domain-containing protein [Bacteroidales bacterium]
MNNNYADYFSDSAFWSKVGRVIRKAGKKLIYLSLILYYTMRQGEIPPQDKLIILAALGYFIFPLDFIADVSPGIGYMDDFGALLMVYSKVAPYVTDEIKDKAKSKLSTLSGEKEPDLQTSEFEDIE